FYMDAPPRWLGCHDIRAICKRHDPRAVVELEGSVHGETSLVWTIGTSMHDAGSRGVRLRARKEYSDGHDASASKACARKHAPARTCSRGRVQPNEASFDVLRAPLGAKSSAKNAGSYFELIHERSSPGLFCELRRDLS